MTGSIDITCEDGVRLQGHCWVANGAAAEAVVIINPATGVPARYYHYYARFLSAHGYDVLTYDYRGIGLSRPERLARHVSSWRHWGERDFEAVLKRALSMAGSRPVMVVGHSIGGILPGYAPSAPAIARMLTMGAQYAYWRDYMPSRRLAMLAKWHVVMPALTSLFGYFPGRRLNWLEDLPAGVAFQWSSSGRRIEDHANAEERGEIIERFAALTAPILAIGVTDDEFATRAAISRALAYFSGTEPVKVMLAPADLDCDGIGHFDLFHARHAAGFWLDTLLWLRDGINPWPARTFA